jgi:Mg-chelatase subunit ChlD
VISPTLASDGVLDLEWLLTSPDPARPLEPATKPFLVAPYVIPSGSAIEVWCGPGCGNHIDSSTKSIKTYYSVDFGRTGAGRFPVVAAAGGVARSYKMNATLYGLAQDGCPVDLDPAAGGFQGWAVIIDHPDGWQSFYMHMSSVNIPADRIVEAGDIIGEAGCTGANSVHLHFDLRWQDPATGIFWDYPAEFADAPGGPGIDLAILIDSTGSMSDDIDAAKARASEIVGSLKAKNPNSRIAIVEFRDFASRTGYSFDFPYHDLLPFTQNADAAIAAINSIGLGHGGDGPETRNCALMHAMTGDTCAGYGEATTLGPWRPGVTKSIIYLTDAPALSPEPFTNFTTDSTGAMANTGGFVLEQGDLEESDLAAVAGTAAAEGIAVYPIVVGGNINAKADSEQIAAATGGKVYEPSNAGEVVDSIISAIIDITGSRLYLPNIRNELPAVPPVCSSGSFTPVDVMFALDRSESFAEQNRIGRSKVAIIEFMNKIDNTGEQVALTKFNKVVELSQPLTADKQAVYNLLVNVPQGDGTAIGDAIKVAADELLGPRHIPGHRPVLIVFSDGENTDGSDPVQQANAAKARGIRIFTVSSWESVDKDALRKIASSPGDFYYTPGTHDMAESAKVIADRVRCGD